MARPLIGLTIGPREAGSDVPRRYSPYARAIELADGVPVLLPPIESNELHPVLSRFAGIVFPGGPDVDPRFYGQSRHPKTKSNPILDELASRRPLGSAVGHPDPGHLSRAADRQCRPGWLTHPAPRRPSATALVISREP